MPFFDILGNESPENDDASSPILHIPDTTMKNTFSHVLGEGGARKKLIFDKRRGDVECDSGVDPKGEDENGNS